MRFRRSGLLLLMTMFLMAGAVMTLPVGAAPAEAQPPPAQLDPSLDGDGDGFEDGLEGLLGSDPTDAAATPESVAIPESCIDFIDNDLDGATDSAEPGCVPLPPFTGAFPSAGLDVFPSTMTLGALPVGGECDLTLEAAGPAVVERSAPTLFPNGRRGVEVELVAMQMTGLATLDCMGSSLSFPVIVVEDPDTASLGEVVARSRAVDFPANSFFNVFFVISTPTGLIEGGPLTLTNTGINTLPPYHSPANPAGNPNCYEFGSAHEHCPKPLLDHFHCYTMASRGFTPDAVGLIDQFQTTDASVDRPDRFCNNASKNDGGVFDVGAHLEIYDISPDLSGPGGIVVVVANQFGAHPLVVVGLEELAVPTRKNNLPPPLALDHYACYEVDGESLDIPVTLEDQFGFFDTQVLEPIRLCNPAHKIHDDVIVPVVDPLWHLVCYATDQVRAPASVRARNQFGIERLRIRQTHSLCVPSMKLLIDDEPRGSITLTKNVVGEPDETVFTFTGDFDAELAHGQSVSLDVDPGTYVVVEAIPDGWSPAGGMCSDPTADSFVEGPQVVFSVAEGETVSCTLDNSRVPDGEPPPGE